MDSFFILYFFWWIERGNVLVGMFILSFRVDLILWMDVLIYGWGVYLEDCNVLGKWMVIE